MQWVHRQPNHGRACLSNAALQGASCQHFGKQPSHLSSWRAELQLSLAVPAVQLVHLAIALDSQNVAKVGRACCAAVRALSLHLAADDSRDRSPASCMHAMQTACCMRSQRAMLKVAAHGSRKPSAQTLQIQHMSGWHDKPPELCPSPYDRRHHCNGPSPSG